MKSIRDVYKIGKGPSSSHTMGPERAARLFLSKYPDAETYRVVLYGSLSKTGRGHGTDRVLYEVLGRERTEVVFSEETPHSLPHPNTLDFFACREGKPYATMRVASIGGGDIRIEGQDAPQEQDEVYPENSFAEIAQFCRWRYISLSEYVELNEGPRHLGLSRGGLADDEAGRCRRSGRRGHAAGRPERGAQGQAPLCAEQGK